MGKDNKNQISTFLMVVGVIFVMIAGSIFVTTAWSHLSILGKQVIMAIVTPGLFVGDYKLSKTKTHEKTEEALFYLGTVFFGVLTYSILAECSVKYFLEFLIANFVMLVLVVFRFKSKKSNFSFIAMAILIDSFAICTELFLVFLIGNVYIEQFVGIYSGLVIAYALADFWKGKWIPEQRLNLRLILEIFYLIHVAGLFVITNICWVTDESGMLFVEALVFLLISILAYKEYKAVIFRILHSAAILASIYTSCMLLNETVLKLSDWNICFVIYVLGLIVMVVLPRKELIVSVAIFGLIIPFPQLYSYGDYNVFFSYVPHKDSIYLPFTLCMMVAFLILIFIQEKKGYILEQNQKMNYLKAISIQFVSVILLCMAASMEHRLDMTIYGLVTVTIATVAFLQKNKTARSIWFTVTLVFAEITAGVLLDGIVPNEFVVEEFCALLAIGIVLLKFVWYDKDISIVTFVGACVIVWTLMVESVVTQDLSHVMVLGITGVIMLLVAAFKNNKKYVILASVTLILLALYITRSFWLSIAWWVYLLIAGIILITIAFKREKEV